MLGRLEMTVQECVDTYIETMDDVFTKTRHRIGWTGKFQGRFDTPELEAAIKRAIIASGRLENERMRSLPEPRCKTYVCQSSSTLLLRSLIKVDVSFVCSSAGEDDTFEVQFTSFGRPGESNSALFNNVKIWEAARATSAAHSFFDPIEIGSNAQKFWDGGLHSNNPVRKACLLAQEIWAVPGSSHPEFFNRIGSLLSIGTGIPTIQEVGESPHSLMNTLVNIATASATEATAFEREHLNMVRNHTYLRLDVDQGLQGVGMEDASKRSKITTATARYGGHPQVSSAIKAFVEVAYLGRGMFKLVFEMLNFV
jgi:hypothetical protein